MQRGHSKARVSVLIPTFNEELNLPDCLDSVAGWSDDVYVVDSFSSDRTVEIAASSGVHVVQHRFEGYAQQKNWALETLPFKYEWVLIVDADERVSDELRDEIAEIIENDGKGYDGFYINRKLIFYGRWIRHCGWYPVWNLRLFKRQLGRYENRLKDEHIVLTGRAGYCKYDLIHEDLRDMTYWIAKHNGYSSKEAVEIYRAMKRQAETGLKPSPFGDSVRRKRFLKERLLPHLPARALVYFVYRYVVRLGFLDGREGLMFCVMHAIFEHFNVAKLWELKNYKQGIPENNINVRKYYRSQGAKRGVAGELASAAFDSGRRDIT
jgi:glycosyltransferase involved in cell wall biosynthesis